MLTQNQSFEIAAALDRWICGEDNFTYSAGSDAEDTTEGGEDEQ